MDALTFRYSLMYKAGDLERRPIGPTHERQLMLIYSAAFELSSLANDLTELAQGGDQLGVGVGILVPSVAPV